MANPEHLAILKQGVEVWNKWREKHRREPVDLTRAKLTKAKFRRAFLAEANLSEANLSGADLRKAAIWGANLTRADLTNADLRRASLTRADFRGANLTGADLMGANLGRTDLRRANLKKANLTRADLTDADLRGADLMGANLTGAILVQAHLEKANLKGCHVYGISAWDIHVDDAKQTGLVITPKDTAEITVDDLEVAQFIYLLLNNNKIRTVIDTITSKVVLILGRFTDERKAVLDALRDELRKRNYSPVLFDFGKPASRDLTETISTLAHMARFIIADITEPRCIPQELATIVPTLSVPVKPLLLKGATGEYAMFRDLSKYPWVLTVYRYKNSGELIQSLETKVIAPAEKKAKALIKSKNR